MCWCWFADAKRLNFLDAWQMAVIGLSIVACVEVIAGVAMMIAAVAVTAADVSSSRIPHCSQR
jgi:hypothetical protein